MKIDQYIYAPGSGSHKLAEWVMGNSIAVNQIPYAASGYPRPLDQIRQHTFQVQLSMIPYEPDSGKQWRIRIWATGDYLEDEPNQTILYSGSGTPTHDVPLIKWRLLTFSHPLNLLEPAWNDEFVYVYDEEEYKKVLVDQVDV